MCGVIGVISREPIASRLMLGQQVMENRGSASAASATYNNETGLFSFYSGIDAASVVYKGINPKSLPGKSGIGHTRYPTSGNDDPVKLQMNLQPVVCNTPGIRTASNGDLVNLSSQRERLRREEGCSVQTEVDAQVIQNTLVKYMRSNAIHRTTNPNQYFQCLSDCVKRMHGELNGAYSTVNITEEGLFAFRDPNGIRPLCIAERRNGGDIIEYIIASESSVVNFFRDYHNIQEIKPGELIFIDNKNLRIQRTITKQEREAFCFFELNYFAMPDSEMMGRKVEMARYALGRKLAQEYREHTKALGHPKERFDCIFGIPNTAITAGAAACEEYDMALMQAVVRRVGLAAAIRTYQQISDDKRLSSIVLKFLYLKEWIERMRLLDIDDSDVRGHTAKAHNKNFARLGAYYIANLFFTPQILFPCFYGQDFQTKGELIAARHNGSLEKIADEQHCNEAFFISLEGMLEALDIPKERLCLACLTGEYPTDVSEAQERSKLREKERNSG